MTTPSNASIKPRALLLAVETPYPMIGGGPFRIACLLGYLAQHFSVHLILYHQHGVRNPGGAIPPGLVDQLDLIELPYHSKRPVARLLRTAWRLVRNRPPMFDRYSGFEARIAALVSGQSYDVAVLEHFWNATYVEQVRPLAGAVMLDLHNVESAWHYSMASSANPIAAAAFRRFGRACIALERTWLPQFDAILTTSSDDAAIIQPMTRARLSVFPNALPEMPLPPRPEKCEIVFSGNLEYPPNVAAVRYFFHQVWPALRTRWPELKWKILGRSPQSITGLVSRDSRILVTGAVKEAVPLLAESQIAVVPLLAGSGTRIKILEAWAAGTPVVSTTLGAEGLECRDQEHLLLADDPAAFEKAVSRLLASAEDRARIGMAGRRLYEERYCWPAAWQALDAVFGEVSRTSRSTL